MAARARKAATKKAAPKVARPTGVKVEMRVNSWSTARGDVVSVAAATAEALVRNGHAVRVGE